MHPIPWQWGRALIVLASRVPLMRKAIFKGQPCNTWSLPLLVKSIWKKDSYRAYEEITDAKEKVINQKYRENGNGKWSEKSARSEWRKWVENGVNTFSVCRWGCLCSRHYRYQRIWWNIHSIPFHSIPFHSIPQRREVHKKCSKLNLIWKPDTIKTQRPHLTVKIRPKKKSVNKIPAAPTKKFTQTRTTFHLHFSAHFQCDYEWWDYFSARFTGNTQ